MEQKKRVRRFGKLPEPSKQVADLFDVALTLPHPLVKNEDLKAMLDVHHIRQVDHYVKRRFGCTVTQLRRKKRLELACFGWSQLIELVKKKDKAAIIFFCKVYLGFRETGPTIEETPAEVLEQRQFKLKKHEADWIVNQFKSEIEKMKDPSDSTGTTNVAQQAAQTLSS